jgi:putative ABC transport system permease protein
VVSVHPTLFRKLVRDMRRQWPQFVTLSLIVALGVAMFIASFGAYRNLTASYDRLFETEHFADLWLTGGDVNGFVANARRDAAVAAAATRIQADLPIAVGADKLRGRIVGIPAAGVGATTLLAGHDPTADDQVLVEHHMADHFGLRAGDHVRVLTAQGWRQLTITGLVSSTEYLWPSRDRQDAFPLPDNFGVLFAPDAIATRITGTPDNQALVRLHNSADGAALNRLITQASAYGISDVVDRARQPSNSLLTMDLHSLRWLAYLFPALFLSVAALMTYVLLARRVRAERPVIGVLIAGGLPRRTVLWHYMEFGLAAGVLGAAAGVLGGAAGCSALSRSYLRVISLPESVAVIGLEPATVLTGIVFGLVVGMISAAAPALLAFHTPPAAAMHASAPVDRGRPSIVERLIPPLRRLPVRWLLVLRNIGRNRWRTASTLVGTTAALLLVLASWLLLNSMNAALDTEFNVVQRADARIRYIQPVDQGQLTQLTTIPGVAEVEPSVEVPVVLSANGRSYATALFKLPAETKLHGFRLTNGTPTHLTGGGVLIGHGIHDQLGINTGDRITVTTPGDAPMIMPVTGLLNEALGTFAYAPIGPNRPGHGQPIEATSALVRLQPGADRNAVRKTVMDSPNVAFYEEMSERKRVLDNYAGLFYALMGAMLILGGLMAFAVIFTTMSVNIVERRREVATLRGGGMPHRIVARLITGENLLVTLLGIVPGLILGALAARAFLAIYTNDELSIDLVVPPATLLISSAAVLLAAGLSQWPGLRAIRNLDLAAVVRERAD